MFTPLFHLGLACCAALLVLVLLSAAAAVVTTLLVLHRFREQLRGPKGDAGPMGLPGRDAEQHTLDVLESFRAKWRQAITGTK